MGHARPDELADIQTLLAQIRELPGLKETKPGIFYRRGKGFLHFHTRKGSRWADIRDGQDWGEAVLLPFEAGPQAQADFLDTVKRRLARQP